MFARVAGIIKVMLKKRVLSTAKFALVMLISVFGMNFGHTSSAGASSMTNMNMAGHRTQSSVECQSSCISALPSKKQEDLIRIAEDDKEPGLYYVGIITAGLLAALYVAKRSASFASNWQPPDIFRLNSQFLLYA